MSRGDAPYQSYKNYPMCKENTIKNVCSHPPASSPSNPRHLVGKINLSLVCETLNKKYFRGLAGNKYIICGQYCSTVFVCVYNKFSFLLYRVFHLLTPRPYSAKPIYKTITSKVGSITETGEKYTSLN